MIALGTNTDGEPQGAFRPRFTGRIDLGHIIQASLLLVGIITGLAGGYFAFSGQVAALQGTISGLQSTVSTMQYQILENQKQVAAVKDEDQKQISIVKDDLRSFSRDMNQAWTRTGDQLNDLRVLVATYKDGLHK